PGRYLMHDRSRQRSLDSFGNPERFPVGHQSDSTALASAHARQDLPRLVSLEFSPLGLQVGDMHRHEFAVFVAYRRHEGGEPADALALFPVLYRRMRSQGMAAR